MNPSSEQLLRLLHLIPLAARPEGIRVADAARLCGVPESQIDRDFKLLAERAWYLPPGRTDDFQIILQGDRILIEAPPTFGRPIRLGLHEMLAVSLALRCAGVERDEARRLGSALEAACAMNGAGEGAEESDCDERLEFVLSRVDLDDIHDRMSHGIVHRRRIHLRYLKEGADAPELRVVEPWQLVHAEGETYLVAWDRERAGPRLFRLDRTLSAVVTNAACSHEVSVDPIEIHTDGALRLIADNPPEDYAEVRYSPSVARWVRERFDGERASDGSYHVRHNIWSESWLVRHVLEFGVDAEVLGPEHLRAAVLQALGA